MKTKMNNKVKALLMACCAVLLVFASVLGTLAYLTATDSVQNTFTVGKVDIKLHETKVDADGTVVAGQITEEGNKEIRIVPAKEITKDPTVTVLAKSEDCYVRVLATVSFTGNTKATDKKTDVDNMFKSIAGDGWTYVDVTETSGSLTYEYRYNTKVAYNNGDQVLDPAFKSITMPSNWTPTDLEGIKGMNIDIVAHAIQSEGFTDAAAAWAAFPTT